MSAVPAAVSGVMSIRTVFSVTLVCFFSAAVAFQDALKVFLAPIKDVQLAFQPASHVPVGPITAV